MLHQDGDRLQVHRGGERLAVHPLCTPGSRQTITIAAHHEGIPLSLAGATGKAKIVMQVGGQVGGSVSSVMSSVSASHVVEARPLWAYEQYAQQPTETLTRTATRTEIVGTEVRHR